MLKIDRNTGRTKTGPLEVSSHASLACRLFYVTLIQICSKRVVYFFIFFFNAKVKSQMIKCINHGFRSDGYCQCCRPRCVLCCVVTHVFRSNRVQSLTLNKRSRRNKSHRYISWLQFERDLNAEYSGVWNEQFYWHFPSKLFGRKNTKLQDVISLVLVRVLSYFKRPVKEQNLFW